MTRILVAVSKQEVSSFNPALSHKEDFQCASGPDVLDRQRGEQSELAGALEVFAARPDIQVVPAFNASAISSAGVLAAADWHWLRAAFTAALRAAGPVDAAYFALHGAMAAEGEDDPEGALLEAAQQILGDHLPLVISLDLHGILTERMLAQIDAHTVFHTYPHEDILDTGARAARLLLRILDEGLRPATALVTIPALVRGSELITKTGIFGRFIRQCEAIERSDGGLAAGMFIGNPFTDVPDLRSNAVVTATDPAHAADAALRLAAAFWEVRHALHEDLTPLAEAVRCARSRDDDRHRRADGRRGRDEFGRLWGQQRGARRACLDGGYSGRALVQIIDPRAAAACFAARVGNTVRTAIGGFFDPARFPPLHLEGRVHLLAEGHFIAEYSGAETFSGPTAVLQVQNYTLVLGSRPVGLHDRSFFLAHGQDPRQFDLVVVKSPHCKPHMSDSCARLINVDAPGAATRTCSRSSAGLPTPRNIPH